MSVRRVVALSGGVGGARLVHGLDRALRTLATSASAGQAALTTAVTTGDDFEHWGLSISPDLDTVMYTLADLAHVERGWGLADESFAALSMMKRYGAEDWFALGDRDIATHVLRTSALRRGQSLTSITAQLKHALGVQSSILPMCDAPFRTTIETTTHGVLSFQDWLVRERGAPLVRRVMFDGACEGTREVHAAIEAADVIVIGPSNPYVSIDPILSLRGVREAVFAKPVIAVSPLIGGKAVKGPLASMIGELSQRPPSSAWLVDHYAALRGVVVHSGDEPSSMPNGVRVHATDTLMRSRADSQRLASEVLSFAERCL